jgi:UDP-N-acetyl-D-glucosamine dehydrogenase
VGIVGIGYVGLPLAIAFAEAGHDVIAVDTSRARVDALARGESHVEDVPARTLRAVADSLHPTTDYARLAATDAIVLCVPTPLSENREPDLTHVVSAASELAKHLRPGHLVVLESTTWPGTTRERLVPLLEESGLVAGRDFNVAYSPERVDPGRPDHTMRDTPRLVAGLTPPCREHAIELYASICDELVPVSTPETAELTKLFENIFRTVNIALVNELAMLADRMGIDVWEVVDAAATKPFGFMRFDPGPGMGGHCLPVDPFYLSWKAREFDFPTEFIELAGKTNAAMPYFCVTKIQRALNDVGKPVKGARILLVGVSYKAGVGDLRESPAISIAEQLRGLGADLAYHDPFVPAWPELALTSQELEAALDEPPDLAVIVTAHPGVDHETIATRAPLLVDLRGVTRGVKSPR